MAWVLPFWNIRVCEYIEEAPELVAISIRIGTSSNVEHCKKRSYCHSPVRRPRCSPGACLCCTPRGGYSSICDRDGGSSLHDGRIGTGLEMAFVLPSERTLTVLDAAILSCKGNIAHQALALATHLTLSLTDLYHSMPWEAERGRVATDCGCTHGIPHMEGCMWAREVTHGILHTLIPDRPWPKLCPRLHFVFGTCAKRCPRARRVGLGQAAAFAKRPSYSKVASQPRGGRQEHIACGTRHR